MTHSARFRSGATAQQQRMAGPGGWARKYVRRLFLTDIFVIAVTMVFAHAARFGWQATVEVRGAPSGNYWWVSAAVGILWVLQLGWVRSREPRILGHGPQEFQRVLGASWRTFAIIAVVGFLTQWQISRGYLLFAIPIGMAALLTYRAAWRYWIHSQRDRGLLQAQVLVVGPRHSSQQMARRLRANPRGGYHVLGMLFAEGQSTETAPDLPEIPVLGVVNDAAKVATRVAAEYVIVSGTDAMSLQETRQLGWQLEGTGVGLIVAPALADVAGPRVQMSPVQGLPLLYVDAPVFAGGRYLLKGVVDRLTAGFMLLAGALPLLAIGIMIRLTSTGPALFRQVRVGRDHRPFTMYKFRTMHVNAESNVEALREDADAGNAVLFKVRADPRVTSVGRYLRRYSLDELPQLLNVIKGDMSLVGPRPPLPSEVEKWEEGVARRQLVKPGLTGLWQVSGRSDLDWEESVRLDVYYAENWSLGGDAVILLRTVGAVLAGRGAY